MCKERVGRNGGDGGGCRLYFGVCESNPVASSDIFVVGLRCRATDMTCIPEGDD